MSNTSSYVTILIPLYNGIEFLKECIDSLKNQTCQNFEVIIGINGHEKESEVFKIAKKYETSKYNVKWYSTKGKVNTLNKMLEDAKYDIICLLDVDDKWLPTKLEKQIKIWNTNQYDVIGTQCTYFYEDDKPNKNLRLPKGLLKDTEFFRHNPIINSSVMLKKSDCYWTENKYQLEDYQLWFELLMKEKKFFNLSEYLILHRIHEKSFFNNTNNTDVHLFRNEWKKKYYKRKYYNKK